MANYDERIPQKTIEDALCFLSPSDLDYVDWVKVGMACKYEGLPLDVWETWSQYDSRYQRGECSRKWSTFHSGNNSVTGKTLINMAIENGFVPQVQKHDCIKRIEWYYANKAKWTDKAGTDHEGYGCGVTVTKLYPYKDATGKYLFHKLRIEGGCIEGKLIRYYTIDYAADKAESCKKVDMPRVLYNLPSFLKERHRAQIVFIVEGEKDCETLKALPDSRFHCTVTAGSAADWQNSFAALFKGLNVVILRDNDAAGLKCANKIKNDLSNYAFSIKIVKPSESDKGDVTDYLQKEGGTSQALWQMIADTKAEYAPWVHVSDKGGTAINAGILAEKFAENEVYAILRNPEDDKDKLYIYDNGVYLRANKAFVKAKIKEYIPASKATDNLLNNIYGLLTATCYRVYGINEFDDIPRYINFKNGLLDLQTKQLMEHDPEVLTTFQFNFDYDPGCTDMPVFQSYINDLCRCQNGEIDPERMQVIQEDMGMKLTNDYGYRTKKATVLISRQGNSGKSVLIRLLSSFYGEEKIASVNLIELNPENRFVLGRLPSCRLIACGDESNSNVKDSSTFKRLTGGDIIKIEAKGAQGYSYTFKGGIIIACNGLPCFTDDKGSHLFDRLLIIPCEHHITEQEKDPEILEKMLPERSAIFNWALQGYYRLKENGYTYTRCEACEITKEEYRKAMDNVYRYASENYIITNEYSDYVSKADFDDGYYKWASAQGESVHRVEKKNIKARMEAAGMSCDIATKKRITVYRGLKEKPADFMEVPDQQDLPFN